MGSYNATSIASFSKLQHVVTKESGGIFIVSDASPEQLEVFSDLRFVQAAGGVVISNEGRILVINRLGKWDFPKGKVESGELVNEAALREVEEECGIPAPIMEEWLCCTYHVYQQKGDHYLKRTDWYLMSTTKEHALAPQTEEGIVDARWMTAEEIRDQFITNTYPALLDVLGEAGM